jgi:hypothetical protein
MSKFARFVARIDAFKSSSIFLGFIMVSSWFRYGLALSWFRLGFVLVSSCSCLGVVRCVAQTYT